MYGSDQILSLQIQNLKQKSRHIIKFGIKKITLFYWFFPLKDKFCS